MTAGNVLRTAIRPGAIFRRRVPFRRSPLLPAPATRAADFFYSRARPPRVDSLGDSSNFAEEPAAAAALECYQSGIL